MYPLRNCLLMLVLMLALASPAAATNQLLTHALHPDTTPTYDSSGQVVEPDVIHVPGGWNGYEYWMAVTPYTCSDESTENPSILASNDGRTWSTPPGAPAPLVAGYGCSLAKVNNDPSIALVDNTLYIYYMLEYRSYHGGGNKADSINVWRISSSDGVTWSAPQTLVWGNAAFHQEPNYKLSETVVFKDGTWSMWYISAARCGGTTSVHRLTSSDGVNWPISSDVTCTVDSLQGQPFHLTVKYYAGKYAMAYAAYADTNGCGPLSLYYAESNDGQSWSSRATPLLVPGSNWDNNSIYRSSFVGRYPNIGVFYGGDSTGTCSSGCSSGPIWHEGFTSVGDYIAPATIQDLEFKKVASSSVTLRWTAPGDDGTTGGHATSYSIRYSTTPITDATWYLASQVASPPTPSNPGVQDTVKITGLGQGVWWYFAIKATDDVGNVSWLSDVPCIKLGHLFELCDPYGPGYSAQPVVEAESPAELAIESVRPNPARDAVVVNFTLPRSAGATLELIDVAGRMLVRRDVDSTPGAHSVRLDLNSQVHGGMAFLRLRQNGASVTKVVAILR
jgi:hypothetical protein